MTEQELDQKIQQHEAAIAELNQKKAENAKRQKGFEKYEQQVADLLEEYGITENDLLTSRADKVISWIKSQGKQTPRTEVYNDLRAYFSRVIATKGTKKRKAATKNDIQLATGIYQHPQTGERVHKKRRSPRKLNEWVAEYGSEVSTWLVQ